MFFLFIHLTERLSVALKLGMHPGIWIVVVFLVFISCLFMINVIFPLLNHSVAIKTYTSGLENSLI